MSETMKYFSDRENGEKPREDEEINEQAWGGIRAEIESRVADDSFGKSFPKKCPDERGVTGSDEVNLQEAMLSRVPNLSNYDLPPWSYSAKPKPPTFDILDLTEFCWKHIAHAQPKPDGYHPFFGHDHLQFDVEKGQEKFREAINEIFSRNGLAYELKENGQIERLAPPVLREQLASAQFQTQDKQLNEYLEKARGKFLTPRPDTRRESLEHLWDAWERLKTLGKGSNKKKQITDILDRVSGKDSPEFSPKFREALEKETRELTWIGNELRIRHSEVGKERLAKDEHVDYLFHRLFSLIWMILKITEI